MHLKRKHIVWALVIAAMVMAIAAVLLFPVFQFVRTEHRQIQMGTAFMTSLKEDDLSGWMAWADQQMAACATNDRRRSITLYADKDELPTQVQKLGLLRYQVDANLVALDWLGGMGCTSLRFRRDRGPEMQVEACYTEDSSEILWPKRGEANHTSEGIRRPADGSPKPSM